MTISIDQSCDKYVDVSKLIYQLTSGRVVLERLPERLIMKLLSVKHCISEIEIDKDTEADFKDDKCEGELDLEQDTTDTKSNDDLTESNDNETQYRIIYKKNDGSRLKLIKGYCDICKKSVNGATKTCLTCSKAYKKYECGVCYVQFTKFSAILPHVYKCQPTTLFICLKCDFQSNFKSKILSHLKSHEIPTNCPHCGRSDFENKRFTGLHIAFCRKKQSLQCQSEKATQCEKDRAISDDEESEYKVINIENDVRRSNYIISHCYNCNEPTIGNFNRSICSKCSRNYKMYQCGNCLIQYSNLPSLITHVYQKCMPYQRFFCRRCDYQCYKKYKMVEHIKTHAKSTKCSNCQRQFPHYRSLVAHLKWCKKNSSFRNNSELNEDDAKLNDDDALVTDEEGC